MNRIPCRTLHRRVGQVGGPLQEATAGADAAQSSATGSSRGVVAGEESDQDPAVAVAGDQRVALAVPMHGADLETPARPAEPPARSRAR